jgi:hypothetical protein
MLTRRQFTIGTAAVASGGLVGGLAGARLAQSQSVHFDRHLPIPPLIDAAKQGVIELVTKGAFSRKSPHASEWRLMFNTCDVTGELASKAFMRWGRE